jgi:hypothetical protein
LWSPAASRARAHQTGASHTRGCQSFLLALACLLASVSLLIALGKIEVIIQFYTLQLFRYSVVAGPLACADPQQLECGKPPWLFGYAASSPPRLACLFTRPHHLFVQASQFAREPGRSTWDGSSTRG